MKRLLLILPLLFVGGCGGYSSMAEARAACREWSFGQGTFRKGYFIDQVSNQGIRSCINEMATRQVLGYQYTGAQEGTTYLRSGTSITTPYINENGNVLKSEVIKKRFKY